MTNNEADHSIFYHHSSVRCIYQVVYVDDIVFTNSDHHDISQVKQHLCHKSWKTQIFLGIEGVARSNNRIVITQRKYALDIL